MRQQIELPGVQSCMDGSGSMYQIVDITHLAGFPREIRVKIGNCACQHAELVEYEVRRVVVVRLRVQE